MKRMEIDTGDRVMLIDRTRSNDLKLQQTVPKCRDIEMASSLQTPRAGRQGLVGGAGVEAPGPTEHRDLLCPQSVCWSFVKDLNPPHTGCIGTESLAVLLLPWGQWLALAVFRNMQGGEIPQRAFISALQMSNKNLCG